MEFKKTYIVTGASSGIGKAVTSQLLSAGHNVIGTSRSGTIDHFATPGFSSLPLDLSNRNSQADFISRIESFVPIDFLINNAGIGPDLNSERPEPITYQKTFDVNTAGTVEFTESLLPFMAEDSKILFVSSKMGSINNCHSADSTAYRMSKAALNMYSRILSNRLNGKISVASIHPGYVKTNITPSSRVNGRLTPEESATRIIDYINQKFQNGDFWDAEMQLKLEW